VAASLSDIHQNLFGRQPVGEVAGPLTVGLLGDFCDYDGGAILTTALQPRLRAAWSLRDDYLVRIALRLFQSRRMVEIDLRRLERGRDEKLAEAFEALIAKLQYEGYTLEDGFDIVFTCEVETDLNVFLLPNLLQLLFSLFIEQNGFSVPIERRIHYAREVERRIYGRSPSATHHYASLLAEPGKALLVKTLQGDFRQLPLPKGTVLDVMIPKQPRFALQEGIDERVRILERALSSVQKYRAVKTLSELDQQTFASLRDKLRRGETLHHVEHVHFEQSRIEQAVETLEESDAIIFGDLLDQAHASVRDLLGLVSKLQERLVEKARQSGALGAKYARLSQTPVVLAFYGSPQEAPEKESFQEQFEAEQQKPLTIIRTVVGD